FGRGGEEAEELVAAGVEFEVVPGITSAIAVPAYAGIPLTHRDHTATVAFITGHEDPKKEQSSIAWDKLATGAGTLVFLMGVGNLPAITDRLMKYGRSPQTPAAVIRHGTGPDQQTVLGIVVGEVVDLRKKLQWFEKRPLFGRRIVVTRAREQASGFLEKLSLLGADCIQFPTIEVVPPESWDPLDSAIRQLSRYDWLIYTSVNGVKYFLERLEAAEKDVRELKGIRIGAIGPGTAKAWAARGISLPAYRTIRPDYDVDRVRGMFQRGEIHMVTFTSSSTVTNFMEMFKGSEEEVRKWMEAVTVACIGPITAKTAENSGIHVDLMPPAYTIESLTDAIVAHELKKEI
ncbi:MAG: HemD protein, partial [Desulfobacteraceae bacterium 4484_190.3]